MPMFHGVYMRKGKPRGLILGVYALCRDIQRIRMRFKKYRRYEQECTLCMKLIHRRLFRAVQKYEIAKKRLKKSTKPENFDEIEVQIEQIFYYVGVLTDSLARLIPCVFINDNFRRKKHRRNVLPDSLSDVRYIVKNRSVSSRLKKLMRRLEHKDSWYNIGFSRGRGLRHRFTHYADQMMFGGHTISLHTTHVSGGGNSIDDLEQEMRCFFFDLFCWLDHFFVECYDELILQGKITRDEALKMGCIPFKKLRMNKSGITLNLLPVFNTPEISALKPLRSTRTKITGSIRDLLEKEGKKSIKATIVSVGQIT